MDAAAALAELWQQADGDPGALARATLTGADPIVPTETDTDTPFGRLRHVVPAARLSETPAYWSRPAVPPGTHPAAWPA